MFAAPFLIVLGVMLLASVAVVVVALVGHGLWLAAGALFGSRSPQSPMSEDCTCPTCGRPTPSRASYCQWCGRFLPTQAMRPQSPPVPDRQLPQPPVGWDAVQHAVRKLHNEGFLPLQALRQVEEAIEDCRQRAAQRQPPLPQQAAAKLPPMPPLVATRGDSPPVLRDAPARPAVAPWGPSPLPPDVKVERVSAGDTRAAGFVQPGTAAQDVAAPPTLEAPMPTRRVPRRSLGEMLGAFMEEHNIRWGELVGGLLVVGSSLALVISLWNTLRQIPYMQLLLVGGAVAAVLGAGLFTHHRWKLSATSRGLLGIGLLLVPLHFLAAAAQAPHGEQWDLRLLAVHISTLGLLGFLLARAGAVLVAGRWPWLVACILGCSVWMLATAVLEPGRIASPAVSAAGFPWMLWVAAGVPVLWFVACHLPPLRAATRQAEHSPHDYERWFWFVGTAGFTLAVTLGLVLNRLAPDHRALSTLMPLSALGVWPVLRAGSLVLRHTRDDASSAGHRTAATALVLAAATGVVLTTLAAWPYLLPLAAAGAAGLVVVGYVALRDDLPVLHVAAVACLALAFESAYHCVTGTRSGLVAWDSPWQARLVIPQRPMGAVLHGGISLLSLSALVAVLGDALLHRARRGALSASHAKAYQHAALGAAAAGAACITVAGMAQPNYAVWTAAAYGALGAGMLLVNVRTRHPALSYIGCALLPIAALWGHWYAQRCIDPWWSTTLAALAAAYALATLLLQRLTRRGPHDTAGSSTSADATATLAAGAVIRQRPTGVQEAFVRPLADVSLVCAWAAALLGLVLGLVRLSLFTAAFSVTAAGVALACLLLAVVHRQQLLVAASQAAMGVAVVGGVHARWAGAAGSAWLLLQWELAALALLSAAWIAARIAVRPWIAADKLLRASPGVDRAMLHAVAVVHLAMSAISVAPYVAAELGVGPALPPAAAGVAVPHGVPLWGEGWWLLGATSLGLALAPWQRLGINDLTAALALAASVPLLAAGAWQHADYWGAGRGAVVPVVSCGLAALFVLAAALAAFRRSLVRGLARLGARWEAEPSWPLAAHVSLHMLLAAPVVVLWWGAMAARIQNMLPGALVEHWPAWTGAAAPGLLLLGLTMRAVVDRRPEYALAACLTATLAALSVYVLVRVPPGQAPPLPFAAYVVAIAAAVSGAVWMLLRRGLLSWWPRPQPSNASLLLGVPLALAAGAIALVLTVSVVRIVLLDTGGTWFTQVGSPAGFSALLVCGAAYALRGTLDRPGTSPHLVGAAGLALLTMLACTLEGWVQRAALAGGPLPIEPGPWGLRTLMLGWALHALLIVVATWWAALRMARPGEPGPLQRLMRLTGVWVHISGTGALLLVAEVVLLVGWLLLDFRWAPLELVWAAVALALVGAAHATMAVWRRSESWAFAASLGMVLAAALIVWRHQFELPLGRWWIVLLQATTLASGLAASLWLAARRHLLAETRLALPPGGLLGTLCAMAFGPMALVTGLATAAIWMAPEGGTRLAASLLVPLATPLGCAAWAVASAVAVAYAWHRAPHAACRVATVALLAGCVHLAAGAHRLGIETSAATAGATGDPSAAWSTLLWSSAALGALLALAAPVAARLQQRWGRRTDAPPTTRLRRVLHSVFSTLPWSVPLLLVAALALRGGIQVLVPGVALGRQSGGALLATAAAMALAAIASRRAVPTRGHTAVQLVAAVCGVVVVGGVLALLLRPPELGARMLAAGATSLGALALAIQAAFDGARRQKLQVVSLVALLGAAAQWGLCPLQPATDPDALHRQVILLAVSAAGLACGTIGLRGYTADGSSWVASAKRVARPLALIATVLLVVLLIQEVRLARPPEIGAPLATWAAMLAAAVLLGLIATVVCWAAVPRCDPWLLPTVRRQAYVYAAQVALLLLGVHVYLCAPWLLSTGPVRSYWPLLVMLVAFAGAALAEWLQRRKQVVLAQPLHHTAVWLPAAALLAYPCVKYFGPDFLAAIRVPYWGVLVLAAVFYAYQAYQRRHWAYTVLTAACGTASLWCLLYENGLYIWADPHVWLIPPALAALVAEFLNRDRLDARCSTSIRYLSLAVVYLSTVANALREHLHPVSLSVLLGLSVLGMLAGMLLRMRSFVLLGTAFCIISVAAMVYYAAFLRDQTWVLYAAGIVLGAGIIAIFAMLEKRRQHIMAALERFQHWPH
jgi:hypothetical protein